MVLSWFYGQDMTNGFFIKDFVKDSVKIKKDIMRIFGEIHKDNKGFISKIKQLFSNK